MVRDILTVLRAILKFVHKNNPSFHCEMDFPMPKDQRKEMRVLSLEEELRFIRFLSDDMDPCKFGILIAIMTGMRIGEICALKWSDINVADGTITVQRTIERIYVVEGEKKHTELVINTPKTVNSCREIPMNKELLSSIIQ